MDHFGSLGSLLFVMSHFGSYA